MKEPRYWFPVRPARNGWGWGTPVVWEGWVAYVVFFVTLVGGVVLLVRYGAIITILFACVWDALFIGLMFWKGEPQRNRDNSSP